MKIPLWIIVLIIIFILCVIGDLYTDPNPPKFSIEQFSVPALNKTSNTGDLYFDLKLRNMNKAIGLSYYDPSTLVFSYNPLEEPYQTYAWVYTVPAFYQGNGKTKHIRSLIGKDLSVPSKVVVGQDKNNHEMETLPVFYQNDLQNNQLRLPSMDKSILAETMNFRINMVLYYRFNLWVSSTHRVEVGADVIVDANTGERVSSESIELLVSDAVARGPVFLMTRRALIFISKSGVFINPLKMTKPSKSRQVEELGRFEKSDIDPAVEKFKTELSGLVNGLPL